MRIAIISAMEKERKLMLPLLKDVVSEETSFGTLYTGKIGDHEVLLGQCGIGKVNAAVNTFRIIQGFKPELVLNTGVAGGASSRTRIGDILVADFVAYHDVWCGPGTQPGVADGMDVFMACDPDIVRKAYEMENLSRLQVGLICSGDRFISEREEVLEIRRLYPDVIAVDMESAAIAQVCCMEGVKFNIIRIVSDTPGEGENLSQYKNFWKEAPEKTFAFLDSLLHSL